MPNRSGFNFHNAFVEMRVDLGLVGLALLILTCAAVLLLGIVRQIWRPSVTMAFIVTLQVVFYIRSYAETGLVAPFSFLTVLWLGGAVYAFGEIGKTAAAQHDTALSPASSARTGPASSRFSGMIQARRSGPASRRA